MNVRFSHLLFCLFALGAQGRLAAASGDVDASFGSGAVINKAVTAIAPAGGGKVYLAGEFTFVQGVARGHIARVNSDGSLDTSFDPGSGALGQVLCLAVQPDGKVLIGGNFSTYNGADSYGLARLNTDGSLDTSFSVGGYTSGGVNCIALQADGKVIVAGEFNIFNGAERASIARLNSDGSLDSSFDPGLGAEGGILDVKVQTDGKFMIGGRFTSYGGTARTFLARLNSNGSLDTSFNPGTIAGLYVYSLALQADGKVVIGGYFNNYNGTVRGNIARVNTNGTLDAAFNPGTGANSAVLSVEVQADGKVLLGGYFDSYNGTARSRIARVNSNGSLDTAFSIGSGANSLVTAVAVEPDGKVLLAGVFTAYNGTGRGRVARLGGDGSLDAAFNAGSAGPSESVYAHAVQPDGRVLIVGDFLSHDGLSRDGVARVDANGTLDPTFDPGAGATNGSSGAGEVHALALQGDGRLLIGGWFNNYNGTLRGNLARLNSGGSLDTSFDTGTGANGTVMSLALQADNKALIGGTFTSYNATPRNRLARLNADGSLDSSFDPGSGADGYVLCFGIQADGKVLIGGTFTTFNGAARSRIARLNSDGSLDASFNPGSGINYNYIGALAVQADGRVLIGGDFTSYNGTGRGRIARLNSDGSLDTEYASAAQGGGADGTVSSIAIQADGKAVIGGAFTLCHGTARVRLARLNTDGSLDATFDPGAGANGAVRSLALQADGKVVIAGDFGGYAGLARGCLARVQNGTAAQSLAATSASRVEWLRGGTAPEVAQVVFETSTDGIVWTLLGGGTRISGGWELTGLSLPGTYHLRARGLIAAGKSTSVAEQRVSYGIPADIRVFAGEGTGAPELADGQAAAVDFGSTPLGVSITRSFTIKSEGAALEISSLTLPYGYALAASFTPFTLAAGSTHTFQVRFLANELVGASAGTVSIASDDPDEASFDFPVTATASNGVNGATLDTTLAGTGILSTAFQHGGGFGQGVAVQSDGKIVVAGYASNGTNLDFAVARYLANGQLDASFGAGGLALMDIDGADDWGRAVAIQSDGKIVVAGTCYNGTDDDFAIARFMPDGSPDNSFDANAKKRTPFGTANDRGWSVAIQTDGKIVVSGEAYYSPYWRFAVVRYTTAGAHDTTFSSDGLATATVGSDDANGRGVAIQSDGKIVVGGHYLTTSNNLDFAAVPFTTVGALDTTFSSDGKAVGTIGTGIDRSYGIFIQSDGGILLAGESHNGTNLDFAVTRFTTTGAWDTTFSGDGKLTTAIGSGDDRARAVKVLANGSIVVAGYSAGASGNLFAITRYTAAGVLDTAFGTGGIATHGLPTGVGSRGYALALDAAGNLIVAGDNDTGTTTEFALARLGGGLNPTVMTSPASMLTITGATLNGTVTPKGVTTQAWFEYGLTPALGSSTSPQAVGDGASALPYSAVLDGLAQGVTYHYRLVAANAGATVVGAIQTFTTLNPEIRLFDGGNESAPELADAQAAPVDFGSTALGTPVARTFTLKNEGTTSLVISSLIVPPAFERVGVSFVPLTLAPGSTHSFQVRFLANTVKGRFTGNLVVVSDDLDEANFEVPLAGRAVSHLPHALDTSFSGDGKEASPWWINTNKAYDVAVQPDGKIVVVGLAWTGTSYDLALARFSADGAPDPSFGTNGRLTLDFSGGNDEGKAVALQTDGKIVVAGGDEMTSESDFALARFLPSGQLDTTFGSNGKVVTVVASNNADWVEDIVIQPDGKIVAVGSAFSDSTYANVAVARYNSNGTLDTSFSGDGKLTTDISSDYDYGESVALQADGCVVVGGHASISSGDQRFMLVRYTPTGALDTTFSSDGKQTIVINDGGDAGTAVIIQPDGKIIIGGSSWGTTSFHFALARVTPSGSLDSTFGTGGKTVTTIGQSSTIEGLVLQADGKLLAGGYCRSGAGAYTSDFVIARYTKDGVPDGAFGTGGRIVTPVLAGDDRCTAIALQADEKIVAVGYATNQASDLGYNIAVARFGADIYPAASVSIVTSVTSNSAVLVGSVNPNGVITHAWCEYGTTLAFGSTTPAQALGYGTSGVSFSPVISGLVPGSTYHCRMVAQNGETTVSSNHLTFTTTATPQQMFQSAMTAAGLSGPAAAAGAMPHGDGVSNLAKYAFNMNLGGPHAVTMTAGGTAGLPAITRPAPGGTFRFEFLRRKNSGLTYLPVKSPVLMSPSWLPLTDDPTVVSIDSTWERVIYEEPYDNGQTARLFGRVQVTLDP